MGYGDYLKNTYGGGTSSTTSTTKKKEEEKSATSYSGYLRNQYGNKEPQIPESTNASANYTSANTITPISTTPSSNITTTNSVEDMLSNAGLTVDDVTRKGGNTRSEVARITNLLKEKGFSDSEIKQIQEYSVGNLQNKANDNLVDYTEAHPVSGTALSGVLKFASTPTGTLSNAYQYLSGKGLSNTNDANALTKTVRNMRNSVTDDMGNVGQFAYGIGTSLMDMIPNIAIGGPGGLAYAGASAAQESLVDSIDRGLSDNKAVLTALATGGIEAALEKIPLGRLEKTAQGVGLDGTKKAIAKMIAAQMGAEAIEEGGTDIANTIADLIINRDEAELINEVNGYMSEGDTKGQAISKALVNGLKTVGLDALAGGISGGIMGLGGVAVGSAKNKIASKSANTNTEVDTDIDTEVDTDATTKPETQIPTVEQTTETEKTHKTYQTYAEVQAAETERNSKLSDELSGYKVKKTELEEQLKSAKKKRNNNAEISKLEVQLDGVNKLISSLEYQLKGVNAETSTTIDGILDSTNNADALDFGWFEEMFGSTPGETNNGTVEATPEVKPTNPTATEIPTLTYKPNDISTLDYGTSDPEYSGSSLTDLMSEFNKMKDEQARENDARNRAEALAEEEAIKQRSKEHELGWQEILRNQRIAEENGNQESLTSLLEQANQIPNKPNTIAELVKETKPEVDAKLAELGAKLPPEDQAKMKNIQHAIDLYFETGKLFNVQAAYLEVTRKMSDTPAQTELALYLGDLITEQIDNPNSPYGKMVELENEKNGVKTPNNNPLPYAPQRTEPNYTSKAFEDTYMPEMEKKAEVPKLEEPKKKSGKGKGKKANVGATADTNVNANVNTSVTSDTAASHQNTNTNININTDETMTVQNPSSTAPSQFATNTLARSQQFFARSKELAKTLDAEAEKGLFNRGRVSEVESIEEAERLLKADHDGTKRRIEMSKEISNVQIDAGAMLLDEMISNGDISGAFNFAYTMTSKIHDAAQGLQAVAKYTRTAAGTILKTQQMNNVTVNNYFNKPSNKPKLEVCKSLSKSLSQIGTTQSNTAVPTINEGTTAKSFGQIKMEVSNSIATANPSIASQFTDSDIDFLARLIEQGATNETIDNVVKQKVANGNIGLTIEDMQRITELFEQADEYGENSKKAAELHAEAYAIAAQSLGEKTFMEKWNTWRYLAMLGNPRTHIRNILGNYTFGTVTNIKDIIGAAIESKYAQTHDIERTKAVVSKRTDADLFEGAKTYFEEKAYGLAVDGDNKYNNLENEIKRAQRTFKSEIIEKLAQLNSDWLTKEDNAAIQRKYEHSLASYLKANGKDASIFNSTNPEDVALLERASQHAIKEAKVATFHEENAFAKWLSSASRSAQNSNFLSVKAVGYGIESVMPFKNTPANILKQGIEYSPAGFVKAISQIKNQADATAVIDSMSKGLTGTAILGLGALLTKLGVLRGSNDDDDKKFGEQNYSINIGNHSYTIDWMAPAALPLFVGVELYKAYEGDANFVDALVSISEPLVEMSMLQGFDNMLKSISGNYGNKGEAMGTMLTDIATGYLTQSVPTLAGQVARTIDPTRRDNYTNKNGIMGSLERTKEKVENKIPFLSTTNDAYVDVWGDTQENAGGNIVGRAINNMILPGYYSNTERTELQAEVERLNKTTDKDLLPENVNKSYSGEKLSSNVFHEYQKASGKLYTEGVTAVTQNADYSNLADETKVSVITSMKQFSGALAKADTLDYAIEDSDYKKLYGIYEEKGFDGVASYLINDANVRAQYNGKGTIPILERMNILENSNMTSAEKGEYLSNALGDPIAQATSALEDGLGYEGFYMAYQIKNNADVDHKSLSQDELSTYLRSLDMSVTDKYYWWNLFFPNAKEIPSLY